MATANVSGDEKQNNFLVEQLYCSPDIMIAGTPAPIDIYPTFKFFSRSMRGGGVRWHDFSRRA